MYLCGCKTTFFFLWFVSLLLLTARAREFFSVTHYNECTFYISISHRLHHRVYVSSASLPLLFEYQVKAFAVSFSKDLCTVYKYI